MYGTSYSTFTPHVPLDRRSSPGHGSRLAVASNFPVPAVPEAGHTFLPNPWTSTQCKSCSRELDCPSPSEYCVEGCCKVGECQSDQDCLKQMATQEYYRIDGFEALGYNINPLRAQDNMYILTQACNLNPDCIAYNRYGWMKHTLQNPKTWFSQPIIKDMPMWGMLIKKSAIDGGHPRVNMPYGIKTFCSRSSANGNGTYTPAALHGVCQQCLGCEQSTDCPDSAVCDPVTKCCVNNPCYAATPEYGRWVDGRYAREPQCVCPDDKKYCCLEDHLNPRSAKCSAEPCQVQQKSTACAYICEDPKGKFDAVMCRANERCCNTGDGAPVCCKPGSDCAMTGNNACTKGDQPRVCAAAPGSKFRDITCFPSEQCCNAITSEPPRCCNKGACSTLHNQCAAELGAR
jgi:hypothetical protein